MPSTSHALETNLGPSLKRWRALNRVKQETLAEDLNVSQSKISRWESGLSQPDVQDRAKILRLLSAKPNAASDRALLELITRSSMAAHLVCDLTHRLLAVSPRRLQDWHVPLSDLMNRPLWRFASDGIRKAESNLASHGWFEPQAPDIVFQTEQVDFPELSIRESSIRISRLPLSDGSFARLVRDDLPA